MYKQFNSIVIFFVIDCKLEQDGSFNNKRL